MTEEVGGVTIGRNYHTSPSSGQEDTFRHNCNAFWESSVMAAMHSGRAVLWLQGILGEQCCGCKAFWESSVMAAMCSGRAVIYQCILGG